MKRWGVGLLLVLISCFALVSTRSSSPDLLQDTDTRVLLAKLRERSDPLSWFTGDWPLENHFYRPISTLTFELDNALHRDNPAGYGLTNALLAALCVLLLFWFVRELTDHPVLSTCSALLFAGWCGVPWLLGSALVAVQALAVMGLACALLPGRRLGPALACLLAGAYISLVELQSPNLWAGVVGWIPGRTASVMAVFALIAMASYCRYERLGAQRVPAVPDPLTPPATRGTTVTKQQSSWPWAVVAGLTVVLALGSYEQAVMLPGVLVGLAITMRLRRYRVRWSWHALFWSLLAGYLILRGQLLPTDVSGYQSQQFRSGDGVWITILGYLFPAGAPFTMGVRALEPSVLVLFTPLLYEIVLKLAGNIVSYVAARRHWILAAAAWSLSTVALLPMAWLHHFDHYHFWPMAIRALFVSVLVWSLLDLWVIAASRRVVQAPLRLSPAPGSLPRQ